MTIPAYPLAQILEVKRRRVEDQERIVKEKQDALDLEKKKLAEREAERDKVLKHYNDKLQQLRDELDHTTNTDKIKQMKVYLKEVTEKLKAEEKKVKAQAEVVEVAKKNLEVAKEELRKRRTEEDKIKTHREDWEKEARKGLVVIEGREQDEMGNIIFLKNQRNRP